MIGQSDKKTPARRNPLQIPAGDLPEMEIEEEIVESRVVGGPVGYLSCCQRRSLMNQFSKRVLAQSFLRRKVRLDFTEGSCRKHRTGIRQPISAQPWRSCMVRTMCSRVMPCKGSRG